MRHSKVGLSRQWEEKTVDRVGGSGGWIRWLKRVGPSGGRVRWLNHVAKRGGKRSGQKRWPDRVAEMRERKGWCPMHHQTRYSDGQTTCPILESDSSCRHHISVRSREATSRRMTLDEFGALVCQTLTAISALHFILGFLHRSPLEDKERPRVLPHGPLALLAPLVG